MRGEHFVEPSSSGRRSKQTCLRLGNHPTSGRNDAGQASCANIEIDDRGRTRFQAFAEELRLGMDGTHVFALGPSILNCNLFMTLDLRAVRICTPSGVTYTTHKRFHWELVWFNATSKS
jgi:hypothetical protein